MSFDNTLSLLFVADVVGTPGFEIMSRILPGLKKQYRIDITIANGENANEGKGITDNLARKFFNCGIDIITGGNHTWENFKTAALFESDARILRPANYPEGNPGHGHYIMQLLDNTKIAVLNLQGRTFMYPILCPFRYSDEILREIRKTTSIVFVDFHAEATAEKVALGWYLDGRVSCVVGTHTHVQTADERILPRGTAYLTDAGMTGAHDSVIGMKTENAIHRFLYQTPSRFVMATDNLRFCGTVIRIDKLSGKALSIERLSLP